MRRIEKFSMGIKIVDMQNGMYVFSQANENFSFTLDRVEETFRQKNKEVKQIALKNTGMRLTVYE
jgi:hypothetical protein